MPENLFLALTVGGIVLLIGGLTVVAIFGF